MKENPYVDGLNMNPMAVHERQIEEKKLAINAQVGVKIFEASKDSRLTGETIEWGKNILKLLSNRKFWGKVTFTFENGVIQIAEKYKKMKP